MTTKHKTRKNDLSLDDDLLDDLLSQADSAKIPKRPELNLVNEEVETTKEDSDELFDSNDGLNTSKQVDYSEITLKDLRQLAKEAGLTGYSKMKKSSLIENLEKITDQEAVSIGSLDTIEEENEDNDEETYTADEIMNETLEEDDDDNWILSGPPTLNDPSSVRDPVDILTSYRDEKGRTIVTDKLLGSLKKRFSAISEIATLPNIDELIALSGIGEQTAIKIWKVSQQYHKINAKTANTLLKIKKNLNHCSTGSKALDELLGGGLESNAMIEFFGEAGMGKTQICYTAAVLALLQKAEGGFQDYDPKSSQRPRVVWIDTESTFKSERIKEIVEQRFPNKDPHYFLENIIYYQILSTDMLINAVHEIFVMPDNIVLVIIDSIMATFRAEYTSGISELSKRQQKLQELMGIIKRNMQIRDVAILATNQATTKMSITGAMSYTQTVASGGLAVAHAVTHRLKLAKKSAGKNKEIVLRKATMVDSPVLAAGEAEFVLGPEGVTDLEKGSLKVKTRRVNSTIEDDLESEDDVEDDILA